MAMIRRIYRIFLILAWQSIIWGVLIAACFGSYWKAQRRFEKISIIWGKGVAWILGIKIKLIGDMGDFKGGLIVSNHTGYVDILVHAAVLPIRFAPKSSIRSWPLLGWFLRTGRPIWVDRSSPRKSKLVAQQFKDTMDHGLSLLVYPEGTSTDGEHGILEFKSTPFAAAIDGDKPVLPTLIRYRETPDGKPVGWYGDMSLLPHLWRMLGYEETHVTVMFMEPVKPEGRDRKELAQFVYGKMQEQYKKFCELKQEDL